MGIIRKRLKACFHYGCAYALRGWSASDYRSPRNATQRAAVMEIGPKSVDSLYGGERLVAERIKSW